MTSYPMDSADQLYAFLPEVYRNRDRPVGGGPADDLHLRHYLEAFGSLLDRVRHTLEQRHDDSFPDNSVAGHKCQDWIVPYFADLLAVTLYSPFVDGRRDEVANAVRWTQRKGTLQAVEEIAEAITQTEAEIQEGWKRVATTARIGLPLLPATAMGETAPWPPDAGAAGGADNPQQIARHPGLRAVTPDLRQVSRAVKATPGSPASHGTRFGGNPYVWPQDDEAPAFRDSPADEKVFWRQANRHGAPCFPDSCEDVSQRTVDLRTPGTNYGRYHPKRVLVFLPPPYGICAPAPYRFAWTEDLSSVAEGTSGDGAPKLSDFVSQEVTDDGLTIYRNTKADAVEIIDKVTLDNAGGTRFEKLRFATSIELKKGKLELARCAVKTLTSQAPAEAADADPLITLKDCLLESIAAPSNTLQTEYVTVLGTAKAGRFLASDCIFAGTIDCAYTDDCVRYSRVDPDFFKHMPLRARAAGITTAPPEFFTAQFCTPGCAVLRQDASSAIRNGAEDGGEMGAHHDWRYGTQLDALAAKLEDYLPVGITPVVIWDERLLCTPPAASSTPNP